MLPVYFLADRLGRPLDEVRALAMEEFTSWLNYYGFDELIAKKK